MDHRALFDKNQYRTMSSLVNFVTVRKHWWVCVQLSPMYGGLIVQFHKQIKTFFATGPFLELFRHSTTTFPVVLSASPRLDLSYSILLSPAHNTFFLYIKKYLILYIYILKSVMDQNRVSYRKLHYLVVMNNQYLHCRSKQTQHHFSRILLIFMYFLNHDALSCTI